MPRGHCFTGLGGGTFNPDGQLLPRRPTGPLFGGHAPTRLDRQSAGGEAVRLDGMKHPIIPPSRCQQAAVPQRKAAHFEQYLHFIPPRPPSCPPPPQSVLERRGVVALQRSSHSTAFVSADKAAQWAVNSFLLSREYWHIDKEENNLWQCTFLVHCYNKFFCLLFSAAFSEKEKVWNAKKLQPFTSYFIRYNVQMSN